MSSLEKEAKEHALVKAFFASDIEAQREALAHEIEACKTMYAKRVIDGDEHARKLCLKLHELAIAEEAMEDLVYESLEKEEVVVIRYHQPSSMSQQAWEAWGDDPEDNV
ncbi:hypothetical protein AaE_005132 [Aphanomyces astaci]|nr:hypothetical protein AaE_005132 [Aphanomyces astaci]